MGINLTKEKLEKIKKNYINKKEENNHDDKLLFKIDSKLKPQNKDYLNITFKKIYKSQIDQRLNDKEKNRTDNLILKNNIEQIEETKKINSLIFKNTKSFEYKTSSIKSINNSFNNNIKNKIDITSTMLDTSKCTKYSSYSSPDDKSDYSDYIDISESKFFNKNNNNLKWDFYRQSKKIRDAYYNKLIIKNIWKPFINEKKSNTLFIFDWDDTLICTSYIKPLINSNLFKTRAIKEKLKTLDENTSNLLNKCLERGKVFIITNASSGWVEYSSTNFLPTTSKILSKVKIISAKNLYSKNYPGDPKQWKIKAFKYAIEKYNINTKLISNIITFGDSYIDLEAIENLIYEFNNPFIKIIKFKENPHLVELEKQILIVISQLDFIINKPKNFSLKISKKKTE